jgi:hypothetical protein
MKETYRMTQIKMVSQLLKTLGSEERAGGRSERRDCGKKKKNETEDFSFIDLEKIRMMLENKENFL